jgi:hypothetical protein
MGTIRLSFVVKAKLKVNQGASGLKIENRQEKHGIQATSHCPNRSLAEPIIVNEASGS